MLFSFQNTSTAFPLHNRLPDFGHKPGVRIHKAMHALPRHVEWDTPANR